MSKLVSNCQSPIEEKFAAALLDWFGGEDSDQITFRESCDLGVLIKAYAGTTQIFPPVGCAAQVHAGNYIVDFMFVAQRAGGGHPLMVAVECDGHEFHARTKQQVARDRSRDRTLTSCGIHVMRFTGSEIHHDATACADEAYNAIYDMYCRSLEDHWADARASA